MIISASRRTDIPAFYAPWFANRVRAGFCLVPNPFNASQVSRIDLRPEAVTAIVFWTRYPKPLFSFLPELTARGFPFYFLVTLLDYPRVLDAKKPSREAALRAFAALSDMIGPRRTIWRYDPIVISEMTDLSWHRERFMRLAKALRGKTRRCVVSFLEPYRKIARRMEQAAREGARLTRPAPEELARFIGELNAVAGECGIKLRGCAQPGEIESLGLAPGACVDAELLREVFGVEAEAVKDPGQRPRCLCAKSRDIGRYDSCLFGCRYCYATSDFARSRVNYASHDPGSPALWGEAAGAVGASADRLVQGTLFEED